MRDLEEVLDRVELVTFAGEETGGCSSSSSSSKDTNNSPNNEDGSGGGAVKTNPGVAQSSSFASSTSFKLESFKLSSAHCYDPNEEARLRDVIKAVGEQQFHSRVSSNNGCSPALLSSVFSL